MRWDAKCPFKCGRSARGLGGASGELRAGGGREAECENGEEKTQAGVAPVQQFISLRQGVTATSSQSYLLTGAESILPNSLGSSPLGASIRDSPVLL